MTWLSPRHDVVRATAAALVDPTGASRICDVTGVHAQTAEEIAASHSKVCGKSIRVRHVEDDTLRHELVANGIPENLALMQVAWSRLRPEALPTFYGIGVPSGRDARNPRVLEASRQDLLAAAQRFDLHIPAPPTE